LDREGGGSRPTRRRLERDASDTRDKERNIGLLGLVGPWGREGERVEIGLLDGILEYPVVFVSFSFFFNTRTWYMYLPYI
jgi:hypothetical protein